MPNISTSSPGYDAVGESRREEHAAWASFGDRTLMLSATILGLSTLFLSRDITLTHTVLLRASWFLFGASMVLGLARLLLDWQAIRAIHSRSAARRVFISGALGAGLFGASMFVVGLGVLIAFAWVNLASLAGPG